MEDCTIQWDTYHVNDTKNPKRSVARALVRLVLYVLITMIHVIGASVRNLIHRHTDSGSQKRDMGILQRWARHLNRALGLEVSVKGAPPEDGVLLVSNHRSYMDITAIGELAPVTFLAKHEVSRWPVLGHGCRLVDVVFVDRESAESRRRSRNSVASRLRRGISIVVFPEGTSYEGPGLLTFKPGIFQVAAQNRFPVMPVAISYEDPDDAWVGDDTFFRHFMQTFSKRRIPVTVHFGPIMKGDDPVSLMKSSWKWVSSALSPNDEYGKVS